MVVPQSDLSAAVNRLQSFSKAPDLQQSYDQAQKTDKPLEMPSAGPTPRTTSFAKTLDPGYEPPKDALKTIPKGRNSEMVGDQEPKPRLVPDGPERKAVDLQAFNKQWAAEQNNASDYQKEIVQAAERVKGMEAQNGKSNSRDNGMEMG